MAGPSGQDVDVSRSPGSKPQTDSTVAVAPPQRSRVDALAIGNSVNGYRKPPMSITDLMSPPEPIPLESFQPGHQRTTAMQPAVPQKPPAPLAPSGPLSPPISPYTRDDNQVHPHPASAIHVGANNDPILFDQSSEVAPSPPQRPLFAADVATSPDVRKLVDDHIANRNPSLFKDETVSPKREDYMLMIYLKSTVLENYIRDPIGWLRSERAWARADRTAINEARGIRPPAQTNGYHTVQHRPRQSRQPRHHPESGSPTRVRKVYASERRMPPFDTNPLATRPLRASPSVSRTARRISSTPEPRSRPVAPIREDKDFSSLLDICPPLSSLDGLKQNSLKVDWKGNALDLSKDPHLHLLHPDERLLAAGLRLDCATYLTSKRRIFLRRLECLQQPNPKEFRKTDAQQACKIDVNKASKLWTAYEKVGWLDKEWMKPYLSRATQSN